MYYLGVGVVSITKIIYLNISLYKIYLYILPSQVSRFANTFGIFHLCENQSWKKAVTQDTTIKKQQRQQ